MKRAHASSRKQSKPRDKVRRIAVGRRATTYRLEPRFQEGLVLLGTITKRPANRLVNEAVGQYLAARTAQVQADLETTLRRVKEFRSADPDFEAAIARFVDDEAKHGGDDPAEGRISPAEGPAQRMVRNLIRG